MSLFSRNWRFNGRYFGKQALSVRYICRQRRYKVDSYTVTILSKGCFLTLMLILSVNICIDECLLAYVLLHMQYPFE